MGHAEGQVPAPPGAGLPTQRDTAPPDDAGTGSAGSGAELPEPRGTDETGATDESGVVRRLVRTARAVADADAAQIESTARQLGESRRYLAPLAWAAGTIVLLVRGIKLLALNWRLTLIELVPAVWVWMIMFQLKQHTLRDVPFRESTLGGLLIVAAIAVVASIAALWCNTVFGFAISHPRPLITPAVQQARPHLRRISAFGAAIGLLLTLAAGALPRIDSALLALLVICGVTAVMLIAFVAVPARILGARKQRLPPRQAVGSWAASIALSAVAMGPGFLLDRIGLLLLAKSGLHLLGLVLLSVGTALYAAGMSSARAVKLTVKLDTAA
jgi:hypothetical protein